MTVDVNKTDGPADPTPSAGPEAIKAIPVRHPGRYVSAALAIVIPQAMRVIVPPTGNEVINMLKTTSLVSAVQFADLFQEAKDIGQNSGSPVEMYFLAAAWYLIMTSILSVGQYYVERHYARGAVRTLPPTPLQRLKAAFLPTRRPKGGIA